MIKARSWGSVGLLAVVALAGCAGGSWQQMTTRHITAYAQKPGDYRDTDDSAPAESPMSPQEIDQLMQALKRLPHGDRYPPYYPPEMVGLKS
jgi:hypothetical protein